MRVFIGHYSFRAYISLFLETWCSWILPVIPSVSFSIQKRQNIALRCELVSRTVTVILKRKRRVFLLRFKAEWITIWTNAAEIEKHLETKMIYSFHDLRILKDQKKTGVCLCEKCVIRIVNKCRKGSCTLVGTGTNNSKISIVPITFTLRFSSPNHSPRAGPSDWSQ